MAPGTIRILLADDHETVREGLTHLLNAQSDMNVIGEAADGSGAIERACVLRPDVVVLDLSMPDMNGLTAAERLRDAVPSAALVVLTRHNDPAYVQQLTAAGAAAYVSKQSSSSELLNAIRAAASGQQYLDTALRGAQETPRQLGRRTGVTARENAVLRMMAIGHSNKQIAAALGISVKTVEVHKANAMRKMNLSGRTDVVRYAALQGWLQDP